MLALLQDMVLTGFPAVRRLFPEVAPGLVNRLDASVERFDPLGETP